jgi:ferritin-like protein
MAQSSASFHESEDHLTPATRDMHRALVSLMEELEAIDWYQQRVDAAHDDGLRAILRHNREEEIEHAAMVLEWIRRRDRDFDTHLRQYLYSEGEIVDRERAARDEPASRGSVGSLRHGSKRDGTWMS